MDVGQKVRVRPQSGVAHDWEIPCEALGTVICRYRLLRADLQAPDRLDVRFSADLVVWGASEEAFEVIAQGHQRQQAVEVRP